MCAKYKNKIVQLLPKHEFLCKLGIMRKCGFNLHRNDVSEQSHIILHHQWMVKCAGVIWQKHDDKKIYINNHMSDHEDTTLNESVK